jgi:fumarate hydratase class I
VELYRKAATSIPPDVEDALKAAFAAEEDPDVKEALSKILGDIRISRKTEGPVCQDIGVPVFYMTAPHGLSHTELRNTVREATAIATENIPLVPNAIDVLSEKNSGNNTGIGFPIIYIEETADDTLKIDLMLKDAGCENVGHLYRLPVKELQAHMDLEGVGKCVIDALRRNEGKGCPPYIIGVGVGATDDQVAVLAKRQLFRRMSDSSEYEAVAGLEKRLVDEINGLGIGIGRTTVMGVKVGISHRHTASYCVYVFVSCWSIRRARLIW